MAMFRRSRKSAPPLRRKQQEIAQQEAQLREKLERLERIVTHGAENNPQTLGDQRGATGKQPEKRLHVSIALESAQSLDPGRSVRRPRGLRKHRREGRIIFLFLLTALAVAVVWLISHLHI